MATKICGIYEVKTKLSELLRFVSASGQVIITDRGRKVALITSFADDERDLISHLEKLQSLGQATSLETGNYLFKPITRRVGGLKRFLDSRNE